MREQNTHSRGERVKIQGQEGETQGQVGGGVPPATQKFPHTQRVTPKIGYPLQK